MWLSVLSWQPNRAQALLPETVLDRRDWVWAAATGVVSAAFFATAITGHPGLGDASETVAGVSALGILHAPGYPAYVIAAKLFTLIIPFGSEAFRVNLFSLVCASASIAGVQLLARRCGAARWAATTAALCLATTAGFVFYAVFAKHDMFSGLLFVLTLNLAFACAADPTRRRMIALGLVFGLGLGSSWPLEILAGPTVLLALFVARRSLSLMPLLTGGAATALAVVAVYGFVMVRAAEDPPLNWGHATTISRLADLIKRTDFTTAGAQHQISQGSAGGGGGSGGAPSSGSGGASAAPPGAPGPLPAGVITFAASGLPTSIETYGFIFADELGVIALVVALGGLLVTLRRRRLSSYLLLLTFVANILGAAAVVSPGSSDTLETALTEEGFLLGCYFCLAVWMAIGATEAVESGVRGLTRRVPSLNRRLPLATSGTWGVGVLAGAVAALLIVPAFSSSRSTPNLTKQPFADRYAATVLRQLPPRAVLFVWGAELTQPLIYHQVVDHQRPDVTIVAADGLESQWYWDDLARRLGRPLPPPQGNAVVDAQRVVDSLLGVRPVYLDPQAVEHLKGNVGYRPVGIVAQAIAGAKEAVSSPAAVEAGVLQAESSAGMPNPSWDLYPNSYLQTATYSTAELLVARSYYQVHNLVAMRQALLNVLRIQPQNSAAQRDIALLNGARH